MRLDSMIFKHILALIPIYILIYNSFFSNMWNILSSNFWNVYEAGFPCFVLYLIVWLY